MKYGYVDTAFRMLENAKAPGWLAMVAAGATTVWERYTAFDDEGHPLTQSMNPGAVCGFLFETVAGIKVAGENRFAVSPVLGGTLTYAKASYDSPYGRITSAWTRENGTTIFSIEVPANTTAELCLPDGTRHTLHWGKYTFTC